MSKASSEPTDSLKNPSPNSNNMNVGLNVNQFSTNQNNQRALSKQSSGSAFSNNSQSNNEYQFDQSDAQKFNPSVVANILDDFMEYQPDNTYNE